MVAYTQVLIEKNMLTFRNKDGHKVMISQNLVHWPWTAEQAPNTYRRLFPKEAEAWFAKQRANQSHSDRRTIVVTNDTLANLSPGEGLVNEWRPEVRLDPELERAMAKAAAQRKARPARPVIATISRGEKVALSQHLEDGRYVAFDFYADWCGPCRQLTPRLEALVRKHPGKVALKKIDIVKWGTPVSQQYQVRSIPYVQVYGPEGRQVFAGNGFQAISFLEQRALREGW